jgi:hypothetical protein
MELLQPADQETIASLDRLSAGFILLRVLWLVLATYVSLFVALSNPDPFLGIGAFR